MTDYTPTAAELLEQVRTRIEQSFDRRYETADDNAYESAHAEGYRHRNDQVIRVLALEIDRLRNQETK